MRDPSALLASALDSATEFEALTEVPLFLGYVLSSGLQGIFVAQVFLYHLAFPNDSNWVKLLVWGSFFVNCVWTAFATYAALHSLIFFGELLDVVFFWAFRAMAPLAGLIALIVHLFFCRRIWMFGKSIILPVIIVLVSLVQCVMVSISGVVFTLGVGLETFQHPTDLSFNIIWLGGSAFCDVLIATALVCLLCRANMAIRMKAMKSVLSKLMALTIETGVITAVAATLELVLFLLYRNTFVHFILFFILPQLYANCMMLSLNSRLLLPKTPVERYDIHIASTVIDPPPPLPPKDDSPPGVFSPDRPAKWDTGWVGQNDVDPEKGHILDEVHQKRGTMNFGRERPSSGGVTPVRFATFAI